MTKRILLAVPYVDVICPETMKSLYEVSVPPDVSVTLEFIHGYGCAHARNMAANLCLDGNYDDLWFVDSDIALPTDALIKLLACNCECAFGWYQQGVGLEHACVAKHHTEKRCYDCIPFDEWLDPQNTGIIDIDAAGFGCMLMKSFVLRAMKYPYFQFVEYPDKGVLSEDLFFCGNAKHLGIRMLCDTSLRCAHVKKITL